MLPLLSFELMFIRLAAVQLKPEPKSSQRFALHCFLWREHIP